MDLQKDGQQHTIFDGHKVSDNIIFSMKLDSIIIKDASWVSEHTNMQKYTHANIYLHIKAPMFTNTHKSTYPYTFRKHGPTQPYSATHGHIYTQRDTTVKTTGSRHAQRHTQTHIEIHTHRWAEIHNTTIYTYLYTYTHTQTSKPRMDGKVTAAFHNLSATGGR